MLATVIKGDLKALFLIATTLRCWGGHYFFPWIAPLTLDPYLLMKSVKQGDIKYHSLSFGMTQLGIERRSPGLLANTLTIMPMSSQDTKILLFLVEFYIIM